MDVTRYAELFLSESREHLSAINAALLDLERSDDPAEPVGALFRAVHTLKGMSATLGYTGVAQLAHEMESLLDRVRSGTHVVTPDTVDLLLAGADALEASVERAVAGESTEGETAAITARIRSMTGAVAPAAPASAPARPVDVPPGTGVVVRIRQADTTDMPGVRAMLLLQRIASLGLVEATSPPAETLEAATAPQEFVLRVVTDAAPEAIASLVRASADIATVTVGEAASEPERVVRETAAPSAPAPARLHQSIRVDVARLDGLMNLVGELVIARGRMAQLASRLAEPALDDAMSQTGRLIGDLQEEIVAARMVPVSLVFDRFPRLIRDAARATGKHVTLTIEGKDIELDRSLLEELSDPLMHLLRNAVDHGLEAPAERAARGKAAMGHLTLSAVRDRSAVLVQVEDDGRGVDRERVRARAIELGMANVPAGTISDEELLRLIARPGLSTAEQVTDLSGRGVGVDAVITRVRQLGGTVELRTMPGEGTRWTLRLPLTLAIVRALLVRIGSETYALPVTHVVETLDLAAGSRESVRGQEVFLLRDEVLPLLRFREIVGMPWADVDAPQVAIIARGDRRAGVVVDEFIGQQEIVVKQYDAVRGAAQLFSGATILADGAPALIVDVGSLL